MNPLPLFQMGFLGALVSFFAVESSHAHGTVENSRMLQVRLAGPAGGTPAPWTESYYTWNQNSNNFPGYASTGFSYADYVPDGTISSAGVNDGVQSGLNFSGLNTPSPNWAMIDVTAGATFAMKWFATAPHDPSHFDVYFTKVGFDVATEEMGWGDLDLIGRWSSDDPANLVTVGAGVNPVTGGPITTYNWNIVIPADRVGHVAAVVVWQREDPAGEAFFSTNDFNVQAIPEPGTVGLVTCGVLLSGLGALRSRKKRA